MLEMAAESYKTLQVKVVEAIEVKRKSTIRYYFNRRIVISRSYSSQWKGSLF
jgi:hypothetical protein